MYRCCIAWVSLILQFLNPERNLFFFGTLNKETFLSFFVSNFKFINWNEIPHFMIVTQMLILGCCCTICSIENNINLHRKIKLKFPILFFQVPEKLFRSPTYLLHVSFENFLNYFFIPILPVIIIFWNREDGQLPLAAFTPCDSPPPNWFVNSTDSHGLYHLLRELFSFFSSNYWEL